MLINCKAHGKSDLMYHRGKGHYFCTGCFKDPSIDWEAKTGFPVVREPVS